MIFEWARSVRIDIQSPQATIEVADFDRLEVPDGTGNEHIYRFVCQEGEISLTATSYRLVVRQHPVLGGQSLSLLERSGVSFERTPCQT